jgi:hypothetical protein
MHIAREKSSQSPDSFGTLRDEKPGVPIERGISMGLKKNRQVCLMSRRRK